MKILFTLKPVSIMVLCMLVAEVPYLFLVCSTCLGNMLGLVLIVCFAITYVKVECKLFS